VTANIALIIESLDVAREVKVAELRAMALDVRDGAERIGTIVRGVMTFSRLEEERRAVMDLRPVLELASNLTSNEIRHRARLVKVYGDTPYVVADEARLGQVFINLLLNAARAIPDGDSSTNEITLTTSTDHEGRAAVEVRDTGAGIAAHVIGRVFDPFFTTKAVGVGTGLGLSIAHGIVSGLGGTISVTSEPGRGTTFRVVLPAAAASSLASAAPVAVAAAAAAPAAPNVTPKRAVILVVDDEPAVGKAIQRVLREHDVTVVMRATTGLELLAADQRFELARRFPDLAARVVFVSGGAFTPDARSFLDRVKNPLIEKPFSPKQLRDQVERQLRR
jgi:two-component system cell cycle sensor histidine kinase/response regulator CckA